MGPPEEDRLMGERLKVRQRQGGYSMVELLVAVTVFALVFAAVSIGSGAPSR
jgi:prepilin-type N-terminal cleavage/methylation domain-containing protein